MSCPESKCEPRLRAIEDTLLRLTITVEEHTAGTKELREFVKESSDRNDKFLELTIKQSEQARKDQMRLIKISLGIFGAVAALVTALAAWLSSGG
jgi:hypothetical protein